METESKLITLYRTNWIYRANQNNGIFISDILKFCYIRYIYLYWYNDYNIPLFLNKKFELQDITIGIFCKPSYTVDSASFHTNQPIN